MADELYHWGILGMKWGIRRYQNYDGTLTEAGKKRYGTKENFDAYQEHKKISAQNRKNTVNKLTKPIRDYANAHKSVKRMSDEELQKRINRLVNEQRYVALTKKEHPFLKAGSKFVGDSLIKIGNKGVDKLSDSLFREKEFTVEDLDEMIRSGRDISSLSNRQLTQLSRNAANTRVANDLIEQRRTAVREEQARKEQERLAQEQREREKRERKEQERRAQQARRDLERERRRRQNDPGLW